MKRIHENCPRVAVLGPLGSFTHVAALTIFGPTASYLPTPAYRVPRRVRQRDESDGSDYGVIAVENIVHGFLSDTFDALYSTSDIQIVGEVYLPIRLNLISRVSDISEIRTVISHDAGLSQCRKFLDKLDTAAGRSIVRMPAASTSFAVQQASLDPCVAALGSLDAANRYCVPLLRENIQDHHDSATRFWILSLGNTRPRATQNKTVFLVEINDSQDSLLMLIKLFVDSGLRITWMNPRVVPGKSRGEAWTYCYFIEVQGHVSDDGVSRVNRALRRSAWKVLRGRSGRMLGSFPAHDSSQLPWSIE